MSRSPVQAVSLALVAVGFVFVLVLAPHGPAFAIAAISLALACATRFYGLSRPSATIATIEKALWGVVIVGVIYSTLVLPRVTAFLASAGVAISSVLTYRLFRGLSNASPRLASLIELVLHIAAVSIMLALVALVRVLELHL